MVHPQVVFAAGVVGIICFLFLGIGFLKSQPKNRSARLFFAISVCGIIYILNILSFNHFDPAYRLNLDDFAFFIDWIPSAVPPLFMIYCLSLFQENKRIPHWLIAAFIFHMALLGTWMLVYDHLETTPSLFASRLINRAGNTIIDFLLLGFSIGAVYWIVKDWRNDLIEGRRFLRWLFLIGLGALIFTIVFIENFLGLTVRYFMLSQHITLCVIAVFGFTLCLLSANFDYSLIGDIIVKVRLGKTPQAEDPDFALDLDAFKHAFIEKKLYRENGLTIAALAEKLNLPEYRLRNLINKHLGFRNFSAMLHHYRIEDASHTLADREQKNIPILTIALNVGYNSITPFNTAFREYTGHTPSEFRKQALQNHLNHGNSTA